MGFRRMKMKMKTSWMVTTTNATNDSTTDLTHDNDIEKNEIAYSGGGKKKRDTTGQQN